MPSGLHRILLRMRVSTDALRIPLLVAMGVAAGYFWRGAFEAGPVAQRAGPGEVVVEAPPAKPPVRIIVPSAPRKSVRQRHAARAPRASAARRVTRRPKLLTVRTGAPSTRPSPPKKPTPRPPGSSSPPPPTGGPPASPPPAAPTTQPAQAPVAAAVPPPASPPESPPNPSAHDEGERPGHGYGDRNHDHTGHGDKHGR
jgi:hypothetical protein